MPKYKDCIKIRGIKGYLPNYISELDCFDVTKEYKEVAKLLGWAEWNYVVWIGRLFTGDADYGELWFDNWDERKLIQDKAESMGLDSNSLYIINPAKFASGEDGPSHTNAERKLFWTDVLKSLSLSLDTLAIFALNSNPPVGDYDHVTNLKQKIKQLRSNSNLLTSTDTHLDIKTDKTGEE